MKIVKLPHPILHQKALPVTRLTPRVTGIIRDMIKTLKDQKNPTGVGLAAPQVAVPLRIFIISPPKQKLEVFINPKILKVEGVYSEKEGVLEGCLSLHGYYGKVKRANRLRVSYQTLDLSDLRNLSDSEEKTRTFVGFPAVIIQHEMDHLEGILFIDHLLEQKGKLYKIAQEENKEVLKEVDI